jgi:AcrR family transcriptional regulator
MPYSRTPRSLSTADVRREAVVASAIVCFAKSGYLGTPITAVAAHAGISPAYVFKLFPNKEGLFVAALERCFDLIRDALAEGAESTTDKSPSGVLSAMGAAYAALISNRDLLILQVHAQSAASVPEINAAFRSGLQAITMFVKKHSHAPDEAVQRFMAYGQLCHLITTLSLASERAPWARMLTNGMLHP